MKKIDLKEFEPKESFAPYKLIQQDEVDVVLLAFAPGQGLKEHTTPVNVFFHVIQGTAEIQVGDDVEHVPEGTIVLSPKDIPHNVRNTSHEDTKILVVKTPSPRKN
ncbi:MAG: cupin domain-containing protein [Thermoplasmata archaeon]